MSFIRTVLGDIPPAELGVCYAHEHIIIGPGVATDRNPDFRLDDTTVAIAELRELHAAGGRAVVDSMPCDCGRDVRKLAAVARGSGIHIVAPTGLHLAKYYDSGHWSHHYDEAQLAALFIADIEEGIDAGDYAGPLVQRTRHRAGVIKIATGTHWAAREERLFAAAAETHRVTGCPILTHTERGALALEQTERLARLGVDLAHVCLSHTDRLTDPGYHRALLATGVRVEFDAACRWQPVEGNPTLELLFALLPEFPHQLMLGMDAARRTYWRHYGGTPGLDYLLRAFSSQLRERGLTDAQWNRIFVTNPARTFAFAPAKGAAGG